MEMMPLPQSNTPDVAFDGSDVEADGSDMESLDSRSDSEEELDEKANTATGISSKSAGWSEALRQRQLRGQMITKQVNEIEARARQHEHPVAVRRVRDVAPNEQRHGIRHSARAKSDARRIDGPAGELAHGVVDRDVASLREQEVGPASADGSDKFIKDFVSAWTKVMSLDRFDLK